MAIRGVPRIPAGIGERPRLTRRFDGPEPLVLAQAPAGYGKSVAMAQWATVTDADGLWLQLREGNASTAALVQHLAVELLAAGLIDDANPLRWGSEALAGGADAWGLVRHGFRMIGRPLTLAFDGLDRLSDESLTGLADLVFELPELSVRGTARRSGPLHEPALALKLDVTIIGATELAMTEAEIRAALGADADVATIARIVENGGLPVVTRLLSRETSGKTIRETSGLKSGETDPASLTGSIEHVVDSLIAAELASGHWDAPLVRFVQATSIAQSFDASLAAELAAVAGVLSSPAGPAGEDAALSAVAEWIDRAESEGLGLRTGSTNAAFTYTPVIREGFERRLRAENPELAAELTRRVARRELADGQPFLALRRAVELRDWELASRVIRGYWNELLRNHGPQLRTLFHGTSLGVLRRQPFVTMLLALDYNRDGHHRLRALEYFALASHAARTQRASASPADRAVLRSIETAALRVSGRLDGAVTAALDGRDILLAMSPDDRDQLGRTEPTLHNQIGTSLFYAGRAEEALESFARSTAVGASKGLKGGLQGLALSAGTLAIAGDLGEARALIREADALDWPEGWITGYAGSFYQVAAAFSALESWDADEAERRIRLLDPHRETIEHWPLLAHVDALIELTRGNPDRARIKLETEMRTQQRRRALASQTVARLARTRSLIELAAGRHAEAEKILGKAKNSRHGIALARIALARAQPEAALRLLMGDHPTGGEAASSRSRAETLALRAGALALAGDRQRADAALRLAVEFAVDRQQGLAFALVPTDALEALVGIAARGGEAASASASAAQAVAVLEGARAHPLVRSVAVVPTLSPRELALARVLPRVSRTAEMAQILSVSPNTVKTQLQGLYRKLGVSNRAEAVNALSLMQLSDEPADLADPADPQRRAESDPFG